MRIRTKKRIKMFERKSIIECAVATRIGMICLQYVANILIPDHEAGVFKYPQLHQNTTSIDHFIMHLFGGFLRWDAHYFMHISIHGYTYENTIAFFPLFPLTIRCLTSPLHYLIPFVSLDSLTLLVYIVFNIFVFTKSALCLFDLSSQFFKRDVAYKAALLFCYNPASIFFIAPYTECLFSYLTFKSMLNSVLLYKRYNENHLKDMNKSVFLCTLFIGLSILTRSNGVLNMGFLAFSLVSVLYKEIGKCIKWKNVFYIMFIGISSGIYCIIPFILYQYYCYNQFCQDFDINMPKQVVQYGKLEHFILAGTHSQHNQSWCYQKFPLAYSYVQSHYWNVGFLKYYTLKQIPNFILALPMTTIIVAALLQHNKFSSSFRGIFKLPVTYAFLLHSLALTLFCIFNIHVQVTTRMISSASPVLYWFSALVFQKTKLDTNLFKTLTITNRNSKEFWILSYFLSYSVIGTVIFCNHLPWT